MLFPDELRNALVLVFLLDMAKASGQWLGDIVKYSNAEVREDFIRVINVSKCTSHR